MSYTNDIGKVATALGLFASVIKSGETWTGTCEQAQQEAHEALKHICAQHEVLMAAAKGADDQISAIHEAFGAPGDYGYESREGVALFALYKFQVELRKSLRAAGIQTEGGGGMMFSCPKCQSCRISGPSYQKMDAWGGEHLVYRYNQCGYSESRPCADAEDGGFGGCSQPSVTGDTGGHW